jgi:hypothetical protein
LESGVGVEKLFSGKFAKMNCARMRYERFSDRGTFLYPLEIGSLGGRASFSTQPQALSLIDLPRRSMSDMSIYQHL